MNRMIVALFILLFMHNAFSAITTVSVDAKTKFLIIHMGNSTAQIPLGLTKGMEIEANPLYFGDADFGIIVVPIEVDDAATTMVYALDTKGKKLWSMDLGAFNASAPLLEKDFVYLATIGKVFKVEKKSGKIIWTHKGLFENKKYIFNGAEPIVRKDDNIIFSQKVHVTDQTGKLVEAGL